MAEDRWDSRNRQYEEATASGEDPWRAYAQAWLDHANIDRAWREATQPEDGV